MIFILEVHQLSVTITGGMKLDSDHKMSGIGTCVISRNLICGFSYLPDTVPLAIISLSSLKTNFSVRAERTPAP